MPRACAEARARTNYCNHERWKVHTHALRDYASKELALYRAYRSFISFMVYATYLLFSTVQACQKSASTAIPSMWDTQVILHRAQSNRPTQSVGRCDWPLVRHCPTLLCTRVTNRPTLLVSQFATCVLTRRPRNCIGRQFMAVETSGRCNATIRLYFSLVSQIN